VAGLDRLEGCQLFTLVEEFCERIEIHAEDEVPFDLSLRTLQGFRSTRGI
jgi:hypothetical protein